MMSCSQCESKDLIEGKIGKADRLIFQLSNVNKPVSEKAVAFACNNCGYIHLNYNPKTVRVCFSRAVS